MTGCDGSADRPAWVVVPARDEEASIAAAIGALRRAAELVPGPVHLVVVDDRSTDRTAEIAAAAARRWATGRGTVLRGPGRGSGGARRTGLDRAVDAARAAGRPDALVASTDADTVVPPHWLAAMHGLLDGGATVIAGDVRLQAGADPRLVAARAARLEVRLERVRREEPAAAHPHFAGANLGFTAATLVALAPLPDPVALEDDALLERCRARRIAVVRDASFPVVTSARTQGRAAAGLSAALAQDARRLGLAAAAAPGAGDGSRPPA